ncbi:hypothetical protein CMV_009261 [Castanea mollissima]|uniref:Reverse transcriptase zinc-binding domain-containing protein n=1 Tax=Castanea mollissima TaxID=60419 RepID=A0A8J4REN6_9ROSI|nr:hypothetical protein CMV_009261 [Castanea mollissima]
MAAQNLVKRGLRWQVGDGYSIQVWQDQWLTTHSTHKVVAPERPGTQAGDVEAILSIPISNSIAKHRLVWAKDKKGRFTVSNAYRLAQEIEAKGCNASCSDLMKMHGVWRGVWSMNLPNKIKLFAWKAYNGILATKDSLFRRKITTNNICEACGMNVETIMHMLCFLYRGTMVWSSSKLTLPFKVQESWSFVDTFSRLRVSW